MSPAAVPELTCRPLSESHAGWGSIACLPWDEETFGFPVADLTLGPTPPQMSSASDFVEALERYCESTRAELISARAPAQDPQLQSVLLAAGFRPVEFSLTVTHHHLPPAGDQPARFTLRDAAPADYERILRIAGCNFNVGRYHGDTRFPRTLADQRYVMWMQRALADLNSGHHVFVIGQVGDPLGFADVILRDRTADLRLAAVDASSEFGFVGFPLFSEVIRRVSGLGARRAVAKVSAANTAVLNIYGALGFRFSQPEITMHWHAPNAPHLVNN